MPKTNVLHLLAASNNPTALDAVQNLLKTRQAYASECEEEGLTALHVAAAWDNLAMCQLLMYFGADPFQKDDNGRTAKDMAKGSVRKFFERLYGNENLEKSRSVQQLFLCALNRLFSCATNKAAKTQLNRTYSWSPSYDGTKNFLSEEEKRLQWAFRKNQPISSLGKKSSGRTSLQSSQELPSSSVKSPETEYDDNMTYVTAPECGTGDDHRFSSIPNCSDKSYILSKKLTSLKSCSNSPEDMGYVSREPARLSSTKIPMKILAMVRQLSDQQLKQELDKRQEISADNVLGECIGPLLETTRPAYELKLARLIANPASSTPKLKYSWALERWITGHPFSEGSKLDQIIVSNFTECAGEQWRGGSRPTSFCYILIDPSVISLPSNTCTMQKFVDSIFYIGKGKRSRPFQHLVDAVRAKEFGDSVLSKSKKLQKIVNLWDAGQGVVSLHIFQNTIPIEAFTREAAMIDAIGLRNLTNIKRGDYYGPAKNWTTKEKTIYGSYLLFNALSVFHVEGCREIYEDDVRER